MPPITLIDLCQFTAQSFHGDKDADRVLVTGAVSKPDEVATDGWVELFTGIYDNGITAYLAQIDVARQSAIVRIAKEEAGTWLKPGVTLPIYGSYWGGKIEHVLDTTRTWTRKRFISPDAFEYITPEGVRAWRVAEADDESRTDGHIVPGGWDHEHCDIYSEKIGNGGDPFGWVDQIGNWLCESCYANFVAKRDLRFALRHPPTDAP